jgi:hypothetical protein
MRLSPLCAWQGREHLIHVPHDASSVVASLRSFVSNPSVKNPTAAASASRPPEVGLWGVCRADRGDSSRVTGKPEVYRARFSVSCLPTIRPECPGTQASAPIVFDKGHSERNCCSFHTNTAAPSFSALANHSIVSVNPLSPLNGTWLRAVRISAFCIFVAIFVPVVLMYASLLTHYDPKDSSGPRLGWAFLLLVSWFPYFWVFWRLRDATDALRVKKTLAHALAWGSFGALFFSSGAITMWVEKEWRGAVILSILAIFQFVLLGSAIKSYYSMERKRGDLFTLVARLGVIPLIVFPIGAVLPNSSFISMRMHEASAADALRAINAAQIQYARTHPGEGFASSLKELGPSPGAALIDEDLANGRRYNYILTLTASFADSSGHITQYALTARPLSYGSLGRRSFFSDQSGVIHYTAADRTPTVYDRVLPWAN